jgi:4-alpha-glucanotransferase
MSGGFRPSGGEFRDMRDIDGGTVARLDLPLPGDIPEGYHRLSVEVAGEPAQSTLIVAPSKAYAPPWLKEGKRLWGIACHLYSLRSENNWGIGDFTDLASLSRITADFGAAAVGVNPLHALFSPSPDHASPYSPSSRLFLNPLYIDVTREPEFQNSYEIRAIAESEGFIERLAKARDASYVDYPLISAIKLVMLEHMHDFFAERHPPGAKDDPRRADFDAFIKEGGEALRRFTLFQALNEHFEGAPWNQWPGAYRRPDSDGSGNFARANQRRLEFHAYLQWLAERQLAEAAEACAGAGMEVGLYMDLAVGVDPNGADAWCQPDAIVHNACFGAPPDAFNAQGQYWGMPPFHPHGLREKAYAPFIAMLRANMRHAGALRVDHVMGLMHFYWIPPGEKACQGAYVRYPFDDLLGILALESVRNRCLVIGEDLGTVPEGFRERMAKEGALSYRVMRFERHADGLFKRPGAYPALSLSTSATHDLSTIKGHWLGHDLELRRNLGFYETEEEKRADEDSLRRELDLLIAALKDQGLVPESFPDGKAGEEETVRRLVVAVERFLARSPSQLLKVNLDDLLVEADPLNLPGTVGEYPNWRRKNSIPLEALGDDPFVNEVIRAVKSER